MAKWKMSWEIIEDIKVVVYTKFLDHNMFEVILKKGTDTSPDGPVWKTYQQNGFASKAEVVEIAFEKAEIFLHEEAIKEVDAFEIKATDKAKSG